MAHEFNSQADTLERVCDTVVVTRHRRRHATAASSDFFCVSFGRRANGRVSSDVEVFAIAPASSEVVAIGGVSISGVAIVRVKNTRSLGWSKPAIDGWL